MTRVRQRNTVWMVVFTTAARSSNDPTIQLSKRVPDRTVCVQQTRRGLPKEIKAESEGKVEPNPERVTSFPYFYLLYWYLYDPDNHFSV